MSLQTAVRVVCDLCHHPSESFDGEDSNRAAMLHELRQAGWSQKVHKPSPRSRGNKNHLNTIDLCPACTARERMAA